MLQKNLDLQALNQSELMGNIEEQNESLMNSHRRSRSHNIYGGQKQSKSERKGGRMLMMKNRLNNNNSQNKNNTPLKGNNAPQLANHAVVLNSEERNKMYNTFMKDVNHSLHNTQQ